MTDPENLRTCAHCADEIDILEHEARWCVLTPDVLFVGPAGYSLEMSPELAIAPLERDGLDWCDVDCLARWIATKAFSTPAEPAAEGAP